MIEMDQCTVIAGVKRAGAYSPNHIGNDAAIFEQTMQHLHSMGYVIHYYSEEEFQTTEIKEPIIER